MLANLDGKGQCTAWADLLVQTLAAQGIGATSERLDTNYTATTPYRKFCVQSIPAQGTGSAVYPGGTYTGPASRGFDFHQVVFFVGVDASGNPSDEIYDPSYGGNRGTQYQFLTTEA